MGFKKMKTNLTFTDISLFSSINLTVVQRSHGMVTLSVPCRPPLARRPHIGVKIRLVMDVEIGAPGTLVGRGDPPSFREILVIGHPGRRSAKSLQDLAHHGLVKDLEPAEIRLKAVRNGQQQPPARIQEPSEFLDNPPVVVRTALVEAGIAGVQEGVVHPDVLQGGDAHDLIEAPVPEKSLPQVAVDIRYVGPFDDLLR